MVDASGVSEGLPPELMAVLRRRGVADADLAGLLNPPKAPPAARHFPDLSIAVDRLAKACKGAERVAICGDYDADGMTSTALLLGVLRRKAPVPRRNSLVHKDILYTYMVVMRRTSKSTRS